MPNQGEWAGGRRGGRTFMTSTNGLPSGSFWKRVSSKRMAPETYWLMPGVVKSRLRHFWRLASEFSMPLACATQGVHNGGQGHAHKRGSKGVLARGMRRSTAVANWVAARLQARADGAGRLVAGQQALAGGNHGRGGGAQLLGVLAIIDRRSVGRGHREGRTAAGNDRRLGADVEGERGANEGEH